MDIVRIKPTQCHSNGPKHRQFENKNNTSTNSILRSLQQDNILIKRKLKEIENRLTKVSDGNNTNN